MSTNRNIANLSITIVKTLVKMAGLGPVADMIDGSQECLNLLADIKNDALGNPNAKMIRSLNSIVNAELDTIQEELMATGLDEAWIEEVVSQLLEATRATIKTLAENDDALIIAVQQPEHFREQLRSGAAPVPDNAHGDMPALYGRILDCVAEEFLTLAPWSANFDRVALTNLLRCFSALEAQIARFEKSMHDRFDSLDKTIREGHENTCAQNQAIMAGLNSLSADVRNISSTRQPANLTNEVWGSRPARQAHWVERHPTSMGTILQDVIFSSPSSQRGSRSVLAGRAGSGKTSIAASIASRCESDKWSFVAWIDASSRSNIEGELIALGESVLGIQTDSKQEQRLKVQQVLATLRHIGKNRCLFVYDNVEGVDDLDGVLPDGSGVHIVVTTQRKSGWSNQKDWSIFTIGNFSRDESVKLLISVTKDSDRETADKLASDLGDLPLAVAQAATTCSRYYANLQDYYADLKATNIEELLEPIEGGHYSKGAIASLHLAVSSALSSIREPQVLTEARTILAALCYLAESGVPTQWLKRNNYRPSQNAYTILQDSSIIDQSTDGMTTSIHRLQALSLRRKWIERGAEDDALKHAARYLSTINDTHCLPHEILMGSADSNVKRAAIDQNTQSTNTIEIVDPAAKDLLSEILHGTVIVSDLEDYRSSLKRSRGHIIEQLVAISTQDHSKALLHTPSVIHVLSNTLQEADHFDLHHKALRLATAVRQAEVTQAANDEDLFTIHTCFATTLQKCGKVHDALQILDEVNIEKTEKGAHNTNRIYTLHHRLARTYQHIGRTDSAIALYEELLNAECSDLDITTESALTIRNDLALAYQNQLRIDESIPLLEQNLATYKMTFGESHEFTQVSRNNLAYAYRKVGRFNECLDLFSEAIKHLENRPNCIHSYLTALQNQSLALRDKAKEEHNQSSMATAIDLLMYSLDRHIDLLSAEHPNTLTARNNLADSLLDAGMTSEAILLHLESLREHIRILGPLHPYNLTVLNNLACAFFADGDRCAAITLLKCCLREYRHILGPDHHEAVAVRNTLAAFYRESGNLTEALEENLFNIRECERIIEPDLPHHILTLNNLALTFCKMNRHEEGLNKFDELALRYASLFGKQHPLVSTVREIRYHIYLDS